MLPQKPAVPRNQQKRQHQQQPKPNNQPQKPAGETLDLASMQEVILMPRLSDTMTEGVIAGWHKKVGDAVKKGDLLADVETDKATMELESYKEGKLLYIGAQKGDKVPVNALLCIIGDEKKVDVEKIVAAAKGGAESASGDVADGQSKGTVSDGNAVNRFCNC